MIDYEALFRAERAKVEELEEDNRQLRALLKPSQALPPSRWPVSMTPAEQAVCLTLLESSYDRLASVEKLSIALAESEFSYARVENDFQMNNRVKANVCNVRKKLKPIKVEIINVWGRGYYIPKSGIEAWKTATERPIQ